MTDRIRYSRNAAPEVLDYFRHKSMVPSFDWRDVWPQEHAHAFTIAKATQIEVLDTIRAAIDKAIERGIPFEQFRKELTPQLQSLGWWGKQLVVDPLTGETVEAQLGSPRRLKVIYDANIRTANAAGLWQRVWRTRDTLPFLVYIRTVSKEPRELHLDWAEAPVVLLVEDPWWETHFPPNGWQCKCSVLQIDEEAARAYGWTPETKAPPLDEQPWLNARTGETMMVPAGIDPGWANNPGFTRQRLLEEYLAGRMTDADPTLKSVIEKDLTSNWLFKKMTQGEFYKFGEAMGSQFASPIGVVSEAIQKAAGAKNGVVWLTPDKAFSIGKGELSIEEWRKATTTLDQGAVVRAPSSGDKANPGRFGSLFPQAKPDYFEVYKKVSGQYYKVSITMRDRTLETEIIKGGARLTIEAFAPVKNKVAELEIAAARAAGLLIKEEGR